MHECLLYALIPSSSHSHTLKILAGVSAMQPISVREHHLIFKPTRSTASLPPSIAGRPAGQSNKPGAQVPAAVAQTGNDLFYLQLVADLTRVRDAGQTSVENEAENELDGATTTGQPHSESTNSVDIDKTTQDTDIEMLDANPTRQHTTDPQAETKPISDPESNTIDWSRHPWTLEFKNLPDVLGKRPATSRQISSIPLRDGNPRSFMEGLGYAYFSSYAILGDRFTHGSISLRLCRTIPISNPPPTQTTDSSQVPIPSIPPLETLVTLPPLDPAGSYILEASVRVTDGSKPELMNRAFAELVTFRDLLKGVVNLAPVDRLTLDPRIKSTGPGLAAGGNARVSVPS